MPEDNDSSPLTFREVIQTIFFGTCQYLKLILETSMLFLCIPTNFRIVDREAYDGHLESLKAGKPEVCSINEEIFGLSVCLVASEVVLFGIFLVAWFFSDTLRALPCWKIILISNCLSAVWELGRKNKTVAQIKKLENLIAAERGKIEAEQNEKKRLENLIEFTRKPHNMN